MNYGKRIACYFVVSLVATVLLIGWQVHLANIAVQEDPSARAWIGFLPLLLPWFYAYGLAYTTAGAVVIEIVLFVLRRWAR